MKLSLIDFLVEKNKVTIILNLLLLFLNDYLKNPVNT